MGSTGSGDKRLVVRQYGGSEDKAPFQKMFETLVRFDSYQELATTS